MSNSVGGTRRKDGSIRPTFKVKPGFIPQELQKKYVIPGRRKPDADASNLVEQMAQLGLDSKDDSKVTRIKDIKKEKPEDVKKETEDVKKEKPEDIKKDKSPEGIKKEDIKKDNTSLKNKPSETLEKNQSKGQKESKTKYIPPHLRKSID